MDDSKNVVEFREHRMNEGEKVIYAIKGYIGEMMGEKDRMQVNGSVILTNQRIVFYCAKGFMTAETFQVFMLDNVNSAETGKTDVISFFYYIKIFTSGGLVATFKTGRTDAIEMHKKIVETIGNKPKVGSASHLSSSIADELGKLAALKKDGILTEDEFSKAKAKLIGD